MDIYQAIILAFIQGISEFLPISSSAHLILLSKLTSFEDQGLSFDVVVHLGTLVAIIFYYRDSITKIIQAFFTKSYKDSDESKLGWGIIFATIPVGITGLLFKDYIENNLRSIEVIAYATLFFGILLGLADYINKKNIKLKVNINSFDILVIGCFQALALIPGTSRSGITITAGLFLGLGYKLATKFSFLLSIPVILLSSSLIFVDLYKSPEQINVLFLLTGFIISAIFAYFTIYFFIKLIDKLGMMPFVFYRILLGVLLLISLN
jgi:undecaprenyl-diphosphatase